jgi:riboflavin-specific deaminase-like protein
MDLAARIQDDIERIPVPGQRPLVNLSYAQSLDGSIAAKQGESLEISAVDSLKLTHQLRAYHEGILVGVGTILADDPRLTVRLGDGDDPQVVILDSQLRMPLNAAVLQQKPPWIATTDRVDPDKVAALENRGVRFLHMPLDSQGRVALPDLLSCLKQLGLKNLMVEGGAGVITSFVSQHLVDFLVLTISPMIVGGFKAVQLPSNILGESSTDFPRMDVFKAEKLGADLIIWGVIEWPSG